MGAELTDNPFSKRYCRVGIGGLLTIVSSFLLVLMMVNIFGIFSIPLSDMEDPPKNPVSRPKDQYQYRNGYVDNDFWAESSMVKIYTTTHSRDRTAVWDSGNDTIRISMARGEYEGFQLAFRPLKDIDETITIDQPTGPSVLGTGNLSMHEVAYAGSYSPDPLIPVPPHPGNDIDPRTGEADSVHWDVLEDSGTTSTFWVTVFVPHDMPSGTYRSNITFSQSDASVIRPLEIRVWDFVLPVSSSLETWFDSSPSSYVSYYPFANRDPEHIDLMNKTYAKFREYRITPGKLCAAEPWGADFTVDAGLNVSVNFTRSDPIMEYYLDVLGMSRFEFPLTAFDPVRWDAARYDFSDPPYAPSANYTRVMGQFIKQVADHYREKGWLDRCVFHYCDDPTAYTRDCNSPHRSPPFSLHRAMDELVKNNAPDLNHLITRAPEPGLYGTGEIWKADHTQYHLNDAARRSELDERYWWSDVGGGIEDTGIALRGLYWHSYTERVDGVAQWGVNYWGHATQNGDPWRGSSEDGNGYMFYPGPGAGLDDEIIPSIRLEQTRDGLEDYEYLALYSELYGREGAEAAAGIIAGASDFATSRSGYVTDIDLYAIRQYLAEAIETENAPGRTLWRHCLNGTRSGPGPWDGHGSGSFYGTEGIASMDGLDRSWYGDGALELQRENAPLLLSGLDEVGAWSKINQSTLNSSITLETGPGEHTEGTGALNLSIWRNDDNESAKYEGGMECSSFAQTDWSGYDFLEFDCLPVGISLLNYRLELGFQGGEWSDVMGVHSLTGTLPGVWQHCTIDISGISRSQLEHIRVFASNSDLEIPFRHYSLLLDNMTLGSTDRTGSGSIVFAPVDLGPASMGKWTVEAIGTWYSSRENGLNVSVRTSATGTNWGDYRRLSPDGKEPFLYGGRWLLQRHVQLRIEMERPPDEPSFSPKLSEARLWYEPMIRADVGFVTGSVKVVPEIPTEGESMRFQFEVTSTGDEIIGPVELTVSTGEGDGNLVLWTREIYLPFGTTSVISDNATLPAGNYELTFSIMLPMEVADPGPQNDGSRLSIRVNARPTAVITAPAEGESHKAIKFDAGQSVDPDGNITEYRWDMGDGTVKNGTLIIHTYTREGLLEVLLTVRDDVGAEATVAHEIVLGLPIPVVEIKYAPAVGHVTTEYLLYASATDPLDAIDGYTWQLPGGQERKGAQITWKFSDDGPHNVSLVVSFTYAPFETTAWKHVRVYNLPPQVGATSSDQELPPGALASFSAEGTTDPDDADSELAYLWDFGDGTASHEKNAQHAFSKSGRYEVNLTVTDDDGDANWTILHIYVHTQFPVADFHLDDIYLGELVTFDGSTSVDPDGRIVEYRWSLRGPGIIDETRFNGSSFKHLFDHEGNYTLNLTVVDSSGDPGYVEKTFHVGPRPTDPDDGKGQNGPEKGDSTWLWVTLAVILVLLIAGVIVIVMVRKRNAAQMETGGENGDNEAERKPDLERAYEEIYGSISADKTGMEDEGRGSVSTDGPTGIEGGGVGSTDVNTESRSEGAEYADGSVGSPGVSKSSMDGAAVHEESDIEWIEPGNMPPRMPQEMPPRMPPDLPPGMFANAPMPGPPTTVPPTTVPPGMRPPNWMVADRIDGDRGGAARSYPKSNRGHGSEGEP